MKTNPPFSCPAYQRPRYAVVTLQRPGDAAALARIVAQMPPWGTLGYTMADLASYLRKDDSALHRYRVMCGNTVVGVICVRYPWLRGPYIELICVFDNHQSRGVGSELIAWLEEEAGEDGNLWALVSAFNMSARRFYARHGFHEIGSIAALVTPEHHEILLRKLIPLSVRAPAT